MVTITPLISSSRVANNSWVGDVGTTTGDISILARLDWVVNRDEYIQVVAMNNGGTNEPLLGSSFNAISVGLSNGTAAYGSVPLATTPSTPYASAGTRAGPGGAGERHQLCHPHGRLGGRLVGAGGAPGRQHAVHGPR